MEVFFILLKTSGRAVAHFTVFQVAHTLKRNRLSQLLAQCRFYTFGIQVSATQRPAFNSKFIDLAIDDIFFCSFLNSKIY